MACGHATLTEPSTCRGTNHDLAGRGLPQRVYRCATCDRDVWVGLPTVPAPPTPEPTPAPRKKVRRPYPAGYRNRGGNRGGNRKTHGTFMPGKTAATTPKYSVALPPRDQRTLKPWV